MPKPERIQTGGAPAAIGPYSQGMRLGDLVFTAGQIPLDPSTMELVGGDDVAAQTDRVLQSLQAILIEAGASLDTVLKTTVFLADMNDFGAMNEVYGKYFSKHKPARSTVEVARLPKDVKVEIEAIAAIR
ncbi:MAG TPA: RidA family protein [Longimicrobiales bacterium]|nr:RidA family protein [Longimicrobiales bacterium]